MGASQPPVLSTGVPGLDDILGGGLTPHRIYLIEGEPGAGKTTAGLQFLIEGNRHGESVVYITLAESHEELQAVADSHGWDISGIHVHDVLPDEAVLARDDSYAMFHPSEVEMVDTLKTILSVVEKLKPTRVVLDSLSELQLLAESPLRYRRQVLALKQFFSMRHCTVILLDDRTASVAGDLQVRSIAHGVIQLSHTVHGYGSERRQLRVVKHRGREVAGGLHDYNLERGTRVSSRPNRARFSNANRSPPACRGSTRCSAAASKTAPARSSWARRAPASRRSRRSSCWPLASAANMRRCSSLRNRPATCCTAPTA
jgi:circadian clock protein KaiC